MIFSIPAVAAGVEPPYTILALVGAGVAVRQAGAWAWAHVAASSRHVPEAHEDIFIWFSPFGLSLVCRAAVERASA